MKNSEKADLIEYRLKRASETLQEIEILLQNDIKASSHSGVRQMLGLHYVKTGKISSDLGKSFTDLFDKRHASDYDDYITISREDVEELLPSATGFIERIKILISE